MIVAPRAGNCLRGTEFGLRTAPADLEDLKLEIGNWEFEIGPLGPLGFFCPFCLLNF
jgi:hypothetical protein